MLRQESDSCSTQKQWMGRATKRPLVSVGHSTKLLSRNDTIINDASLILLEQPMDALYFSAFDKRDVKDLLGNYQRQEFLASFAGHLLSDFPWRSTRLTR